MTNTAGEPIIGATVLEKGNTTNGTITDIDGNFTINLPANATLSISYIGYITQEIQVGYQTSFKVVLKDDTKTLDEIIVVGYGSQKKANLTGAVSSVKMDEALGDRPLLNAADALQGAVPGLFVSNGGNAPGTSKSFQIRGAYSLGVKNSDGTYGNTIKPLVLIDNVEGDIDMINPEDIESINVLKDAASAAIYGARAAGGVILVTTKRPKGASRFELNYNNNFAFGKAVNLPKQAPLMDYLQAYLDCGYSDAYWSLGSPSVSKWMEYLTAYQKDPSSFNTVGDGIYVDESGVPYYLNEKDLYKNFMETSFQMTHNISASGGTDKLRYRISGGYNSNDGVLISDRDKFERMNVNSFISADVTKWFTQEITMSYAHSLQTSPGGMGGVYNTRLVSYYPEGELPASVNTLADEDLPLFTPRNQILYSNPVNNKNDNPRIFLKSILKPLKGLEAVFEYTFDKNIYDYHWYTGQYDYTTIQGGSSKSFVDDYLRKYKQHTNYNSINVYATYNKDFGNHHFKVMAGFNQESSYQETLDTYSYNQAVLDVPAMSSGTGTIKATDSYSEYAIRGGFFRVNYNYLDKYLLEVNGRYDGSSKFAKKNRYGLFPSASLAWNFSEEDFMKEYKSILSNGKLRASWGLTGNNRVGEYEAYALLKMAKAASNNLPSGVYPFENNQNSIGMVPISLANKDLKWETTEQWNVGLDLGFFDERIGINVDWYMKTTRDLLLDASLPYSTGYYSAMKNVGKVRNSGLEFTLNTININRNGFRWSTNFNIAFNKNKVLELAENQTSLLTSAYFDQTYNSQPTYIAKKGYSMGMMYGYMYEGTYKYEDFYKSGDTYVLRPGVPYFSSENNTQPGMPKYKDLNGDGIIDTNDRTMIGRGLPIHTGGFTNDFEYKGFDLSIFFQWSYGNDVLNANRLFFENVNNSRNLNQYATYADRWTPENPTSNIPVAKNSSSNKVVSSRVIEDGSFLRLKTLTLGYTLPKKALRKWGISTARVYVAGQNLWTISGYSGYDPEVSIRNSALTPGLDYSAYPRAYAVNFGINLGF